jgi:hypothetical protein
VINASLGRKGEAVTPAELNPFRLADRRAAEAAADPGEVIDELTRAWVNNPPTR